MSTEIPCAGVALTVGVVAVGMSLGGTHFAVLYDDGSVHCDGNNAYGQCDTGTWNLG